MRFALDIAALIGFVIILVAVGYYLWPLFVFAYFVRIAVRLYKARITKVSTKHPVLITFER